MIFLQLGYIYLLRIQTNESGSEVWSEYWQETSWIFSAASIYLLQTELISPDLMCSQSIELNLGASCDLFQQLWYTYRGFRLMHLDPKYGQKQPTKTGSQLWFILAAWCAYCGSEAQSEYWHELGSQLWSTSSARVYLLWIQTNESRFKV